LEKKKSHIIYRKENMETTKHSQQLAGNSTFRMIDVGPKEATRRRAVARGTIRLSLEAFIALQEKTNPKGDVLALAEIAGIQAVKRAPEMIPLCHTLAIEAVRLWFDILPALLEVTVFCEVGTTSKTGVEMEALSGVNGALLTIYDLSKAVNPVLSISEIRLDLKEGGKSGRWTHPDLKEKSQEPSTVVTHWKSDLKDVRAALLVVSDRCAKGTTLDRSGPQLSAYLKSQGADIRRNAVVADEVEEIRREIAHMCNDLGSRLIIATGGTGASLRDVTPEALAPLWTKKLPGIGEALRIQGSVYTPMSWLSRSEGGIVGRTLVILLPGSLKAVEQALLTLDPMLSHLLHIIEGGNHEALAPKRGSH
jgi:cyclic pyranopterin phosphate synthase